MADTPTASRSNTASTAETSPPSEGSTVSGPAAPANTIIDTLGNQIPNPMTLSALLGSLAVNPPAPPSQSAISAPADIPARHHDDQATDLYPEASNWAADAEEDLENALKRMAVAADDKNKADPSKSVKQYYSEALAKIIKKGEIEFDVSTMVEQRETETKTEGLDSTASEATNDI